MLLEWFRRRNPKMSTELKDRLFTSASIVGQEQAEKGEGGGSDGGGGTGDSSLGIGSLKGGQAL
jgi:hypothetical protein